jgi:serine/threonine protein kinase
MGSKERPWEPEWVRGESLSGGGQARTYFARHKSDPPDSWPYVMKVFKSDDDRPDLRARMYVEAGALERVVHQGVAKLVASNPAHYTGDGPLFLITELVEGPDLERFRAEHELPVRDAVQLVIRVLRVLSFCHNLDVVHRDIKPEHVILRDGALDAPVLIDFGLAFGDALSPNDHSTATEQGVGNRFLILPEHWADSTAKRDPVSDITQVVGLLFFLIFKKTPGNLAHPKNRKPHDRFAWRDELKTLESWQLESLATIFDVGFEHDPVRRWQSAEQLIAELEVLMRESAPPPRLRPVEDRLKQLKSQADNSTNQIAIQMQALGTAVHMAVLQTADGIHNGLSQYVTLVRLVSTNWEPAARRYRFQLSLQSRLKGTPQQIITYTLQLFGTEVFVYQEIGKFLITNFGPFGPAHSDPPVSPPPGELLKVPVFDPRAKSDIQNAIENDIQALVDLAVRD